MSEARRTSSRFREWLIDKLSRSRWPHYRDQSDEEVARKLGVTLEVLHAARAAFDERTRKEGLMPGQRLGQKLRFRIPQDGSICLEPPREIYEEWTAIRDRLHSSDAILLRTVIHAVLQINTQPEWLSDARTNAWIWQGRWLGQENIRLHLYRLRAKVNEAAYQALLMRAHATKCTPSAIARWGVILFVHGKLPRYTIVSVPHAMYKTTAEYCTNPKVVALDKKETRSDASPR